MMNVVSLSIGILFFVLAASSFASAQPLTDFKEFYRLYRIGATEAIIFCYPTEQPLEEPMAVGVRRDSLGRPTQLTQFRFGNLDTRSQWTTMRIEYASYDSINVVIHRRTFYNASGMPINVDWAASEEVYFRKNGQPFQRKLLDRAGKPVNDTTGVSRSLFKLEGPGTYFQEWYYSNGKLHFGTTSSDGALRPFGPMPEQTYYRRFVVNDEGNLTREEVFDFDRKPIPFSGGELVRAYEVDDCGMPVRITFLDREGRPMTDDDGVAYRTFSYDDAGRLVEWRAFGANGSPKGRRSDGVAGMRYTFRAFDGVLLKEERFDGKGNPLP